MQFLNKAESAVLERIPDRWSFADSIAVASMIWPELIGDSLEAHMSADLRSSKGPGSVLVDDDANSGAKKNVEIIRCFDVATFKDKLLRYLA